MMPDPIEESQREHSVTRGAIVLWEYLLCFVVKSNNQAVASGGRGGVEVVQRYHRASFANTPHNLAWLSDLEDLAITLYVM